MQVNIVNVAVHLTSQAKLQASLSVITSISDFKAFVQMLTLFNRSINLGDDGAERWNSVLHFVVEECIGKLTNKSNNFFCLSNFSASCLHPKFVISKEGNVVLYSLYISGAIANSGASLIYALQAFLEALFQQLLLAMSPPDPNIRGGSHRIFSAIHMPTIICPWSILAIPLSFNGYNRRNTFGSTLRFCLLKNHFGKAQTQGIQCQWINVRGKDKATEKGTDAQMRTSDASSGQYRVDSFQSKSQSMVFPHLDKSTEG